MGLPVSVGLLPVGGCGALVAVEVVVERKGNLVDPSNPVNCAPFTLQNDTSQRLHIRPCDDQSRHLLST